MLERLINAREMTIKQLATQYDFSFAAVAKHVSVLQKAKLVTKKKEGRTQVVSINPIALKTLDDYAAQYKSLWGDRFDRLDNLLKEIKS